MLVCNFSKRQGQGTQLICDDAAVKRGVGVGFVVYSVQDDELEF